MKYKVRTSIAEDNETDTNDREKAFDLFEKQCRWACDYLSLNEGEIYVYLFEDNKEIKAMQIKRLH